MTIIITNISDCALSIGPYSVGPQGSLTITSENIRTHNRLARDLQEALANGRVWAVNRDSGTVLDAAAVAGHIINGLTVDLLNAGVGEVDLGMPWGVLPAASKTTVPASLQYVPSIATLIANGSLVVLPRRSSLVSDGMLNIFQSSLTSRSTNPGACNAMAVKSGIGTSRYVACGNAKNLQVSDDGWVWSSKSAVFPFCADDVAYGNGMWAATYGYNQNAKFVMSSADGVLWTCHATPVQVGYIAYGAGHWVVASQNWTTGQQVFVSTDLDTWTACTYNFSLPPVRIRYANNQFFAFGNNGTVFFTSPNGLDWTQHDNGLSNVNEVIWNGTQYLAVTTTAGTCYTSPDGIVWTPHSTVGGHVYKSVAWNGTVYCAVGASNQVATSPDGITWTSRSIASGSSWNSIAVIGTTFAVVGNTNTYNVTVWSSTNGTAWTQQKLPFIPAGAVANGTLLRSSGDRIACVTGVTSGFPWFSFVTTDCVNWYGLAPTGVSAGTTTKAKAFNGLTGIMVDGTTAVYARSVDGGATWASLTSPAVFGSVAYGGGVFVGYSMSNVYTSPDGINWTPHTYEYRGWVDIVWNGRVFMVWNTGGDIATSPDGITWTVSAGAITGPTLLFNIGTRFVMCTWTAGIFTSDNDGAAWTKQAEYGIPSPANVAFNGSVYLVFQAGSCWTSPDGINWTSRGKYAGSTNAQVIAVGSAFVALATGTSYFSNDNGVTWSVGTPNGLPAYQGVVWRGPDGRYFYWYASSTTYQAPFWSWDGVTWHNVPVKVGSPDFTSIATNGSIFVAVAEAPYLVYSTSDGATWSLGGPGDFVRSVFRGVAFGRAVFCAVGDSTCATSPDGINWTYRTIPAGNYYAITWNGSLFVAVGVNRCATSPDGINWTLRTIPSGTYMAIGRSGPAMVAVGVQCAAYSKDGINWVAGVLPSTYTLKSVAWSGVVWMAVGLVGSAPVAVVSMDGINWRRIPNPVTTAAAVLWDGMQFLVAGSTASLATSSVLTY